MKKRKISSLQEKAEKAFKKAVRHVIEEHRRIGLPLVIWRDGKIVKLPIQRALRKAG